jgi:hypothetical protein
MLRLLCLLGCETFQCITDGRTVTKIARCVTGSNVACRRVVAMLIFKVLAGYIAEVAHVSTR